jgi:integrase/recombinase XerC
MAHRRGRTGARTLRRDLAAVRGFLGWIEDVEGVQCAAILTVATPRAPSGPPRPVPAADAQAIVETVSAHREPWIAARDAACLTLIWGGGLRVSEALGLDWGAAPLGESLRVTGKGGRVRELPVLPVCREAIEDYRRLCPHRPGPAGPLFLGARGGRLRRAAVAGAMAEARRALGLPEDATPHALRHAFATDLLAAGGDLRTIQTLLGHRSLSSTQIYTKVDDARLRAIHASAHPRGRG